MIINQIGGGGGSIAITNGILEAYKSSGADIAPNTFVEFAGATLSWGAETAVSSATGSGTHTRAVQLDTTHVLFAYETGASNAWTINGHILTFSGGTITVGSAQTLATYTASKPFCVIPMSATKAVLYCGYGSQTYPQHIVLTISGNSITTSGAGVESTFVITYGIEGCKVSDTAYLIVWRDATASSYWSVRGYAFDGTSITMKQAAVLGAAASNRSYVYRAAATQMTDGLALIVGAGSSNYPTAMLAAADSNDDFTFGTATALDSVAASAFRVTRINDSLALALFGSGTNPVTMYAAPISIS